MRETILANNFSARIGHEGIKLSGLTFLLCVLFMQQAEAQSSLETYTGTLTDPQQYGVFYTHEVRILSDSVLVYSIYRGENAGHCDSVFPGRITDYGDGIRVVFADRPPWNLRRVESHGYLVLERDDGFRFLRPVPVKPGRKGRKPKKRGKNAQRCPEF